MVRGEIGGGAGVAARARKPSRASVQHFLDGITGAAALVHNARLDNLAANQLGRALYADLFAAPRGQVL